MSPNLFGLYLDDLQAALQDTPNSDCPVLGDTALPLLLYADDLAILSHSQEGLQCLMDALLAFGHTKRLTVNIEKTKAMVFSRKATSLLLTYQGQQIEQVSQFRYLGLDQFFFFFFFLWKKAYMSIDANHVSNPKDR